MTVISDTGRRLLICSCEGTMPLDADAIRRGCRGEVTAATQLCGAELGRFKAIAAEDGPLTVACTQQAALFSQVAAENNRANSIQFANIRETAGWSGDADRAGPKMAALLAAAAEVAAPAPMVQLESSGVILIYGRDEAAIEAGDLLKEHLDVTVLIAPPAMVAPPRSVDFPIAKGRITAIKGHLGAFDVVVDDFAEAAPSSRRALTFGPSRNNARSSCDIILDLTGGPALVPADLRDGYLRADPGSPAAILQAVLKARDLVGTFEKPRYITFDAGLCAHSRSKRTGCTRCLDSCPAGAITPAGNHVAIDANICAGCGQCATACPTGAASYALPAEDALVRKLRAMLLAYRQAGGERAVVLVHDESHGAPLIDALSRFGDGLPANVLPFAVNEVTQVGLESIIAAFAYGVSAVRFLLRAKPRHDVSGLTRTVALADPILVGLGFGPARLSVIATDDPDRLIEALRTAPADAPTPRPASFRAVGGKRDVLRFALAELHRAAPAPVDVIPLPDGAPFGAVEIDTAGCTLCLACVSAARRVPCATTPSARRCGSSKIPASSAACAGRRARRKSSRWFRRLTSVPAGRQPAFSRKRSRFPASAAASHSASRAASSAWWRSSKASTGCIRARRSDSTPSRCAATAASASSPSKVLNLMARRARPSAPRTITCVTGTGSETRTAAPTELPGSG